MSNYDVWVNYDCNDILNNLKTILDYKTSLNKIFEN